MSKIENRLRIGSTKKELLSLVPDENVERVKLLLDRMESLIGQDSVKPVHFCVDEKDVVDHFDFGTFAIYEYLTGINVHFKGGLDYFISSSYTNAFVALRDMMLFHKELAAMTQEELDSRDEESKNREEVYACFTMYLQSPTFAFNEDALALDMGTIAVRYINDAYNRLMDQAKKNVEEGKPEPDEAKKDLEVAESAIASERIATEMESEADKMK